MNFFISLFSQTLMFLNKIKVNKSFNFIYPKPNVNASILCNIYILYIIYEHITHNILY